MTVNKVGRINRDNDLPIHIWFGPYRLLTWNDVWFFNVRCSNPGYHWKYNWNEPSHVVVVGWLDTIRIFFTLLKDRVWKEKNRDTFFKDISYYFTRFFFGDLINRLLLNKLVNQGGEWMLNEKIIGCNSSVFFPL